MSDDRPGPDDLLGVVETHGHADSAALVVATPAFTLPRAESPRIEEPADGADNAGMEAIE